MPPRAYNNTVTVIEEEDLEKEVLLQIIDQLIEEIRKTREEKEKKDREIIELKSRIEALELAELRRQQAELQQQQAERVRPLCHCHFPCDFIDAKLGN